MGSRSANIQFSRIREIGAKARNIDEYALDDFIDGMTGDGCLGLLKWARRHTPHLLRTLMASFLSGQEPESSSKGSVAVDRRSLPGASPAIREARSQEPATLRMAERQHISRVISESRSLREAASKLGISHSTLWRKRKLYRLAETQGPD